MDLGEGMEGKNSVLLLLIIGRDVRGTRSECYWK